MNANAYTARAFHTSGAARVDILMDGLDFYGRQLMEIVNATPREDLPLILGLLELLTASLAGELTDNFSKTLVSLMKKYTGFVLVKTPAPKTDKEVAPDAEADP